MAALGDLKLSPGAVYGPSWLSRETGKFTPEPGFLVDISPWIEEKIAAVTCHRSQHGLFLRHGTARAGRPVTLSEMIRHQEALFRILPVSEQAGNPLQKMLNPIKIPNLPAA